MSARNEKDARRVRFNEPNRQDAQLVQIRVVKLKEKEYPLVVKLCDWQEDDSDGDEVEEEKSPRRDSVEQQEEGESEEELNLAVTDRETLIGQPTQHENKESKYKVESEVPFGSPQLLDDLQENKTKIRNNKKNFLIDFYQQNPLSISGSDQLVQELDKKYTNNKKAQLPPLDLDIITKSGELGLKPSPSSKRKMRHKESCSEWEGENKSRYLTMETPINSIDRDRKTTQKCQETVDVIKLRCEKHKELRVQLTEPTVNEQKMNAEKSPQQRRRTPSECELRISRSLQNLNLPQWYKNSPLSTTNGRPRYLSPATTPTTQQSKKRLSWAEVKQKSTSVSSLTSINRQSSSNAGDYLSGRRSTTPHWRPQASPNSTVASSPFSFRSRDESGNYFQYPPSSSRCTSPFVALGGYNYTRPYTGWRSSEQLARDTAVDDDEDVNSSYNHAATSFYWSPEERLSNGPGYYAMKFGIHPGIFNNKRNSNNLASTSIDQQLSSLMSSNYHQRSPSPPRIIDVPSAQSTTELEVESVVRNIDSLIQESKNKARPTNGKEIHRPKIVAITPKNYNNQMEYENNTLGHRLYASGLRQEAERNLIRSGLSGGASSEMVEEYGVEDQNNSRYFSAEDINSPLHSTNNNFQPIIYDLSMVDSRTAAALGLPTLTKLYNRKVMASPQAIRPVRSHATESSLDDEEDHVSRSPSSSADESDQSDRNYLRSKKRSVDKNGLKIKPNTDLFSKQSAFGKWSSDKNPPSNKQDNLIIKDDEKIPTIKRKDSFEIHSAPFQSTQTMSFTYDDILAASPELKKSLTLQQSKYKTNEDQNLSPTFRNEFRERMSDSSFNSLVQEINLEVLNILKTKGSFNLAEFETSLPNGNNISSKSLETNAITDDRFSFSPLPVNNTKETSVLRQQFLDELAKQSQLEVSKPSTSMEESKLIKQNNEFEKVSVSQDKYQTVILTSQNDHQKVTQTIRNGHKTDAPEETDLPININVSGELTVEKSLENHLQKKETDLEININVSDALIVEKSLENHLQKEEPSSAISESAPKLQTASSEDLANPQKSDSNNKSPITVPLLVLSSLETQQQISETFSNSPDDAISVSSPVEIITNDETDKLMNDKIIIEDIEVLNADEENISIDDPDFASPITKQRESNLVKSDSINQSIDSWATAQSFDNYSRDQSMDISMGTIIHRIGYTPRGVGEVSFDDMSSIGSNLDTLSFVNRRLYDDQRRRDRRNVRSDLLDETVIVRCARNGCKRSTELRDARINFKTCRDCYTYYCSHHCRKEDKERHRRQCLHARSRHVCKLALQRAKENEDNVKKLSTFARKSYESSGRGYVRITLLNTKAGLKFARHGLSRLEVPLQYMSNQDVAPDDIGDEVQTQMMGLCDSYDPLTKFILLVTLFVNKEVTLDGIPHWERNVISKSAKIRLARDENDDVVRRPRSRKNSSSSSVSGRKSWRWSLA